MQCESLIEEHEEDLIPSFQVGLDDMSEIICCDLMSKQVKITFHILALLLNFKCYYI